MFTKLAPLLFVLLWSSSFIAAKAGLRHLSPLLFVAIRLAGCAAVLMGLMLLLRCSWQPLSAGRSNRTPDPQGCASVRRWEAREA